MSTESGFAFRFGVFQSLRPFTRKGVVRDAVAGFQLAAMNIPQALGYTKIAGTPIVTGFYTLLLPLVAFAAFGSSRYLVVAADSATAAILAGSLSSMAPLGSERYVALASLAALLTAILLLLARLLKLGFVADFLSQTVLIGFLTGVGFQVGIAVTGEMLGMQVHARRTVLQLAEVIGGFRSVHRPTLFIFCCGPDGYLWLTTFRSENSGATDRGRRGHCSELAVQSCGTGRGNDWSGDRGAPPAPYSSG